MKALKGDRQEEVLWMRAATGVAYFQKHNMTTGGPSTHQGLQSRFGEKLVYIEFECFVPRT